MKTLYFMRHAKSDWSDGTLSDHDRPLNARGRRAAAKMGAILQRLDVNPDVVLCSTAVRACETLSRVMSAGNFNWPIVKEQRLYGAGADAILQVIRQQPATSSSILLVGHNPGFEDLVVGLSDPATNISSYMRIKKKYPTAAFAAVMFDVDVFQDVSLGRGTLRQFIKPKDKTIV